MRINSPIKVILIFVSFCFVTSCNLPKNQKLEKHFTESFFEKSEQLAGSGNKTEAVRMVDSAYASFPFVSVADKYRYYLFKAKLFQLSIMRTDSATNALIYADSMISIIEETGLKEAMAKEYGHAFALKTEFCMFLHRYDDAFKAVSMSKYLSSKNGDTCTMGTNTAMLGMIAYQQSRFLEAANQLKEAVGLFQHCTDDRNRFYNTQGHLDNIGLAYSKIGEQDSALFYFKKAEAYILQNKQLYGIDSLFPLEALSVVYSNITSVLKKRHDYAGAENFILKTLELRDRIHNNNVGTKIELAGIFIETGKINQAYELLNEAATQLATVDASTRLSWYQSNLKIAEINGKTDRQLYFTKQYYFSRDSMLDAEKGVLLADPSAEYDKLEKKYQIALLVKNNRLQQTYTFASVCILVLAVTLLTVIFFGLKRSQKSFKLMKRLNFELEKNKEELTLLMEERERRKEKELREKLFEQEVKLQAGYQYAVLSQRKKISTDMHDDLSGSLSALRFYVEDMKKRSAEPEMKKTLSDISEEVNTIYKNARQYMHNLNAGTQAKKYDLVTFLTDISRKFTGNNLFKIDLDIEKEQLYAALSAEQNDQLYHVAKEIISNILKHAFASEMLIEIKFTNDTCKFLFKDNGKGFNESEIDHGLGLHSIRTRIADLGGSITIDSKEKGTIVKGEFPLSK